MGELLWLFVSSAIINNFVFSYFLGICPFLGVSGRISKAIRMGAATTFVMVMSALFTWLLYTFILPYAPYLKLLSFIIVIASLVQFTEIVIKRFYPLLFRQLGIYLPLITTNCAILGLAIFQTNRNYDLAQSLIFAFGAGLGFTLALVMMASLREELDLADIPGIVKGTAINLMIAGILSIAFMGFAGLFSA